jgi:hypothetical protein
MTKLVIFFVFTLPLLVVDPPVYSFFMIGMFPGLTALMVDRRPGKSTGTTIMFFNLAGVLIYMIDMLNRIGANKFPETLSVIKIFTVYLFAGCGYFIVWLVPRLFVIYVDYKNQARAKNISTKISELIEEWGPEVRL